MFSMKNIIAGRTDSNKGFIVKEIVLIYIETRPPIPNFIHKLSMYLKKKIGLEFLIFVTAQMLGLKVALLKKNITGRSIL